MQMIFVSRGTYAGGKELSEKLAAHLGFDCVGREELIDEATHAGVPVGKLEMAIVKPHTFTERLARERAHFHAFMMRALCERAARGSFVYHGRTGHLLMRALTHLFRVRVVADMEYRVKAAMGRLHLDREKARRYIEQVEEDRKKWVKYFYQTDWESATHYDVIVSLQQMNVDNAASALCAMAQLPDFQLTPADLRKLENLKLASTARVALARDERTFELDCNVSADRGVLTVTFPPAQARAAREIPEVLRGLPGIENLQLTPASTNILWIEERYDIHSDTYRHIVQIANKWNASVELLRMVPEAGAPDEGVAGEPGPAAEPPPAASMPPRSARADGGIEDDVEEEAGAADDGCLRETGRELVNLGLSGGVQTARGGPESVLAAVHRDVCYSLIVVGGVFISKGKAARQRLGRDLGALLHEKLRTPVVSAADLGARYLFRGKDFVRLLVFLAVTAVLYLVVFSHQKPVLALLAAYSTQGKVFAAVFVAVLVPIIAYIYGTAVSLLLKWLKVE